MKRVLLGSTVVMGIVTAVAIYERLFREKTFGPTAIAAVAVLSLVFLSLLVTYVLFDTRYRRVVGNLWLAVAATGISFFVLDLAAGFVLIRPLSPPLVPDEYRHHKLLPNSFAKLENRDFSYVQRVNNVGIRGQDVSVQKPADSYRILMLGDSFTMGKGVEDDQTFSVLLEKALNQEGAACRKRVEVLNGGVDSYAPILSLIQMKRELHALSPDMVMLNFDNSDLLQEAAYREEAVFGDDGEALAVPQVARRPSLTDTVRDWTDRHLFFTRAALFYLNQLAGYRGITVRNVATQANLDVLAHTLASDSVDRTKQWRNVFHSISRLKAFCDARGIRFFLTVYPWAHQINTTEWVPGRYSFMPKDAVASDKSVRTIKALAAEHGIDVVDVYAAFQQHRGSQPLYFQHDMHWTTAGHEVMAKGLEQQLTGPFAGTWCR